MIFIYIAGNILTFIACVIMMLSGLPKSKKVCLGMQIGQLAGLSVATLMLGSIPACLANLFGGIRNVVAYKTKLTWYWKAIFIVIPAAMSIIFNNIGWFAVFPIFGAAFFTLFVDTPSVIKFKAAIIICNIAWAIHDIYIQSYVALAFDILSICTNFIGIIRVLRDKKTEPSLLSS